MAIVDLQEEVRPIADVQSLLRLGQERGYVTSEEIMALVEEFDMTVEEIEDLYSQLFDQSIEIYEQSPVTQGVLDTIDPTLDLSIQTVTQDPLRLYLKEAGIRASAHQERRSPAGQAHRDGRQAGPRTA